jgi:protein-disulfide isomerase-like protein with CxxC motif
VLIGLTEDATEYEERGYTPLRMARGYLGFRRFGMPFGPQPKERMAATARACRAVVATRLRAPEREWAVFRALQLMQFCSARLLDDDADILHALSNVRGIDAEAIVDALDDPEVVTAYEADHALARLAEGTPAHAQGKTACTDGPERFSAPTLIFEAADGRQLIAGGFQSQAVYDTLLMNLEPGLERRSAPEDLGELLEAFPDGLTTAEVAEVLAEGPALEADREAAEDALIGLAAAERAMRVPVGDDALWLPGTAVPTRYVARLASGRFAA